MILDNIKKSTARMNEINDKKITRIEWGIVFVAILLPLYSFLYIDTNSIIRCGIDVFKSIVEGGG